MTPYSPPAGDGAPAGSEPVDKPTPKPKRTRRDKSMPDHDPEAFETFWSAYPRKDNRKKSIEAWDKLNPDRELCRVMWVALKRQCRDPKWLEEGGKFIPYFSTWLNQRRWENAGVDLSLVRASKPRGSGYWAEDPEVEG